MIFYPTELVREVTGRTPRTFGRLSREYPDEFRIKRPAVSGIGQKDQRQQPSVSPSTADAATR